MDGNDAPFRGTTAQRLAWLRTALTARGLDGFVVPHADAHQAEYLPANGRRLEWLTGFTGSAGAAIVLAERAAIFVDGRYTLQVRAEVDMAAYAPLHLVEDPPAAWIERSLAAGQTLGYDPWLHTAAEVERLGAAAARAGAALVPVAENPIDAVWADRPPPPPEPVVPHPDAYAGRSATEKRHDVAAAVRKAGAAAAVLTASDSIAWLLNIRGADVPHTPMALAFAVLHGDERVDLFLDPRKLTPGTEAHLGNSVAVRPPPELGAVLDGLGGSAVLIDPALAPAWILRRLEEAGATVVKGADPCALPRARKNAVELEGTRAAHRRDGAAMARFLAWLARAAPSGTLGEIEVADRLRAFRAEDALFRDVSFSTIAGAGPNGAIVHYRATPATERRLEPGSLFLLDSGAQYLDGTTDITRTVAIGAVDPEARDRFTRVLKGHIALATARFPRGTTGSQLDALARRPLWEAGLDFDHGTGHGVGSYLGVHEGPQRISKVGNTVALEPGMILSNEPGYYKAGAYGIRIENLLVVQDCAALAGAERPMLDFETLTLAPIDLTLVDPALLDLTERAWLDAYHARVRDTLAPLLDDATRAWLTAATRPIA